MKLQAFTIVALSLSTTNYVAVQAQSAMQPPPPPNADVDCTTLSTCNACLSQGNVCAWAPVVGCIESCAMIADTSCFTADPDTSPEDVCGIVNDQAADAQACNIQTDCTSCVSTTLISEPTSTCQWFPDLNHCAESCKMFGCGEATCLDDLPPPPPPPTPPCEIYESCDSCLNDPSGCSWAPVVGCIPTCDMIADTSCYEVATMENGAMDVPPPAVSNICSVADTNVANDELCESRMDCGSCVDTVLIVPPVMNSEMESATCQWLEFPGGGGGNCISGCGMAGCGTTTCPAASTSTVVEPSNTADEPITSPTDGDGSVTPADTCDSFSTCEDCVADSCAWAPVEGCISSCSIIADTSCFDGQVATCPDDASLANRGSMSFPLHCFGALVAVILLPS